MYSQILLFLCQIIRRTIKYYFIVNINESNSYREFLIKTNKDMINKS